MGSEWKLKKYFRNQQQKFPLLSPNQQNAWVSQLRVIYRLIRENGKHWDSFDSIPIQPIDHLLLCSNWKRELIESNLWTLSTSFHLFCFWQGLKGYRRRKWLHLFPLHWIWGWRSRGDYLFPRNTLTIHSNAKLFPFWEMHRFCQTIQLTKVDRTRSHDLNISVVVRSKVFKSPVGNGWIVRLISVFIQKFVEIDVKSSRSENMR